MTGEQRFILTQRHFEMLEHRRAIDDEFAEFMRSSIEDRRDIRGKVDALETAVAGNTRTINEVHTALFAKDDDNEFGITGLVTNMQDVVRTTRFIKRLAVGVVGIAGGLVTILQLVHMWGAR